MGFLGGFQEPVIFDIQVMAGAAITKFKAVNAELYEMGAAGAVGSAGIDKVTASAKIASGILLGVGAAAAVFGVIAVKAAMDSEVANASLLTALENTGDAVDGNYERILKLSEAHTELGFTNDETVTAVAKLTTATGHLSEAEQLLGVTMDLSRYKHIGLEEASLMVARASQGNAKAFKEMGISLDTTLPKQEAVNKAFNELEKRIGGQSAAYLDTFRGKLVTLHAKFDLLADQIGTKLIPYLIKALDFFNKHLVMIAKVTAGVILFTAAYKVIYTTMKIVNAVTAIRTAQLARQIALEEAVTFAQSQQAISQAAVNTATIVGTGVTQSMVVAEAELVVATEALTIAQTELAVSSGVATRGQTLLNIAVKANPYGVALVAVMALVGGLTLLFGWLNKSADAQKKLNYGTTTYSAGGGGKGFSGGKGVATKNWEVYDKGGAFSMGKNAGYKGPITLTSLEASDAAKAAEALRKQKEAEAQAALKQKEATLKSDAAKVKSIYKEMNDVLAADKEQRIKILENYKDNVAAIEYDNAQRVFHAERSFNDDLYKLDRDNLQNIAKIKRESRQKDEAAQKDYDDATLELSMQSVADIEKVKKDSAEKEAKIREDAESKITDIMKAAGEQRTAAIKSAADKQAEIVKKSIALLTDAFNSATSLDIGKEFAESLMPPDASEASLSDVLFNQVKDGVTASVSWWGSASAPLATGLGALMNNLKAKLLATQQLAKDASALAAKGFSQSFIQSVVGQGTTIGSQMSQAILNSTPETINELQSLYSEIQNVSEQGVTQLATQMNAGANLATNALKEEYAQVSVDLAEQLKSDAALVGVALADVNKEMETALKDNRASLAKSLEEQALANTEALAKLDKQLQSAKAVNALALADSLTDAKDNYNNSLEDMNTTLSNSLADAKTDLDKALLDAQKAFETAIKDTTDATMKSLKELQDKLKEVAAEIAKLTNKSAGVKIMAQSPASSFLAGTNNLNGPIDSSDYATRNNGLKNPANITISAPITVTTPQEIPSSLASLVKFGNLSLQVRGGIE